jgi:hypothetical protein
MVSDNILWDVHDLLSQIINPHDATCQKMAFFTYDSYYCLVHILPFVVKALGYKPEGRGF